MAPQPDTVCEWDFLSADGNFTIDESDDVRLVQRKLKKLRGANLKNCENLQFCIQLEAPITVDVSRSIVRTFRHYSDHGKRWKGLVFQDFDQLNNLHQAVLSTACQCELFQFLWMTPKFADADLTERMTPRTACSLKDSMIQNLTMRSMSVLGFKLSPAIVSILGEGLSFTTSLTGLCLRSRGLEGNFDGLKENATLERLELDGVSPHSIVMILNALKDHPRLKFLGLKKCRWFDSAWSALYSLLSQSKLDSLDLSHPLLQDEFDVDALSVAVQASNSLKRLKLRGTTLNQTNLPRLLESAAICSQLIEIDLAHCQISSMNFNVPQMMTTRLKRLILDGNPIVWQDDKNIDEQNVLRLLQSQPELGYFGDQFERSKWYTCRVQFALDMNRSGSVLFRENLPVSIWPSVLARVNAVFYREPTRQTNVLYGLVQNLAPSLRC